MVKGARPWVVLLLGAWMVAALAAPPATVTKVDLQRYQGGWYEIARLPNRFQDQCVSDVTAAYRIRDDGRIDVTNRCLLADGQTDEALGVARVVEPGSGARLEVSFVSLFGWQLFWGDYWILDLDESYDYSVVGTPGRGYGWILARTPDISPALRVRIDQVLRAAGYDPARFVDTRHTGDHG